jgi:hypothetical protein
MIAIATKSIARSVAISSACDAGWHSRFMLTQFVGRQPPLLPSTLTSH